ncbi:MAG: hypothetical protein ACRDE7_03915, partial [Sphingobacterium sp.]
MKALSCFFLSILLFSVGISAVQGQVETHTQSINLAADSSNIQDTIGQDTIDQDTVQNNFKEINGKDTVHMSDGSLE